ncbi:VOC family protein [Undibacterium sp. TC9W]|uniref:VOC family protein n=1 Tax=Undibacterium sp. TC9W TaxID=3413053 RepID=UPI003BF097F3
MSKMQAIIVNPEFDLARRNVVNIELDHTIVLSHDKLASAKLLAELLGVPWSPTTLGPFAPVFVSEGLTLDFIRANEDFPVYHLCFRVSQQKFDDILSRIKLAGIFYRSSVCGPVDMRINT